AALVGKQEMLGHIEGQEGLHAVEAETLPHLGHEADEQPGRMAKEAAHVTFPQCSGSRAGHGSTARPSRYTPFCASVTMPYARARCMGKNRRLRKTDLWETERARTENGLPRTDQ